MISTSPVCCTSDYYSGSDIEYDDRHHFVKAAPQQYHSSSKQTNILLQTLLQQHNHQILLLSPSYVSFTIRLIELAKENHLSDEIFIRANFILHKFLLSTSFRDINESILIACLSLSTKLSEHSTYSNIIHCNPEILLTNENVICNAVDWDIDIITPVNYVEAILSHVLMDSSIKDRLRMITYELIVLCLADVRCMDLSVLSMGMGCLLLGCELLNCCEIIPKEVLEKEQEKNPLFETSLIYIRQVLINNLHQ